jgi:deoxyribodipyrimidine photo-lyase
MTLLEGETLFPPGSIRNGSDQMFRVFTPFSKVCWSRGIHNKESTPTSLPPIPSDIKIHSISIPSLTQLKIERNPHIQKGGSSEGKKILHAFLSGPVSSYSSMRDRMDHRGTSRLSAHIKFGTLSIRSIWQKTILSGLTDDTRKFLNELLWREFSHHMLWEWPELLSTPFRQDFRDFPYLNNQEDWRAWLEGKTGYPIVDAAARELLTTGYVHNRARMISASFLTKHLLIDYRRGEEHFMKYLTDGDWAQNNAGWQWSAGCGCDAQPWFRIFNPITQALKFDPSGEYVRKYVPELSEVSNEWIHTPWLAPKDLRSQWRYPNPIIGLDEGRQRFLAAAKVHLKRDTP